MVAFNGGEASERALLEAIGIAKHSQAHVWVTFVLDESKVYSFPVAHRNELIAAGGRMLEHAQLRLQQAGVSCQSELLEIDNIHESVAACLKRYARRHEVDLVVMGTSGRSGLRRMAFGSVAEEFVRIAQWPTLLVHGDS
jgi:nucleotide-binding universal stress UspA family protein